MADSDSSDFQRELSARLRCVIDSLIDRRGIDDFIRRERCQARQHAESMLLGMLPPTPPENEPPIAAPVMNLHQWRIDCVKRWLSKNGIPEREWKMLGTHGLTTKKIYSAVSIFPAFKSERGCGEPLKPSSFMRKFWKKQDVFQIAPIGTKQGHQG